MLRRSLLILLPLAAVATGCSTFSDSDAVARVDDVELTRDEFDDRLVELGVTDQDVLPLDPVRAEISRWIQSELIDLEEVGALYDAGPDELGTICVKAIVVTDQAVADAAIDSLETGASFDEVFAANNLDEGLNANGGLIPCLSAEDLEESADIPFIAAASAMSATDNLVAAPILDQAGGEVAWVVLQFQPFAELQPADTDLVTAAIDIGDRVADADIFVDARYGVFDERTGTVVALR